MMVNISLSASKSTKQEIISQLLSASETFVSGQAMSRRLGVSRTAIWKHIKALRREGFHIAGSPHLGYRLLDNPDLLSPAAIRVKLQTKIMGQQIHYLKSAGSTQEAASSLAQQGAPEGTMVIAEQQDKGRGRWGRPWASPPGGLWFSIILRPSLPPQKATIINLAAGVAVATAIKGLGCLPVLLKWPNDVLIKERKVAGIIGEMVAETDTLRLVILGIGINVNVDVKSLPAELHKTATSLSQELGHKVNLIDFLCQILENFETQYNMLLSRGVEPVLESWRSLPNILGRQVRAEIPDGSGKGIAIDVDADGALVIEEENGEMKRILAGDVILVHQEI